MLSWITEGFGAVAAPDPQFEEKKRDEEDLMIAESPLLNIVAPNPQYRELVQQRRRSSSSRSNSFGLAAATPTSTPGASAGAAGGFTTPRGGNNAITATMVECQHCHKSTPVQQQQGGSTGKAMATAMATTTNTTPLEQAMEGVCVASRQTNEIMRSPIAFAHGNKVDQYIKLLQLIADTSMYDQPPRKPGKKSNHERLQSMLEKDPSMVWKVRATGIEHKSCPKGYTPLMVVAKNGNLRAMDVMLKCLDNSGKINTLEYLQQTRNLDGETVLHIATTNGQYDIIERLNAYEEFERRVQQAADNSGNNIETPPTGTATPHQQHQSASTPSCFKSPPLCESVDIMGRTPLGAGLTSPNPKVKPQKLIDELMVPNDKAIYGTRRPHNERYWNWNTTSGNNNIRTNVAVSDMPGVRIDMEDAIMVHMAVASSSSSDGYNNKPLGLLGVYDGHGDGGKVSSMVADRLRDELTQRREEILKCMLPSSNVEDIKSLLRYVFWSVDDDIQKANIPGGSTGVMALITDKYIIVANVGDSRCILVQKGKQQIMKDAAAAAAAADEAAEQLQQLSLKEEGGEGQQPTDGDDGRQEEEGKEQQLPGDATTEQQHQQQQPNEVPDDTSSSKQQEQQQPAVVVALSEDHTPVLEIERQRCLDAGVEVIENNKISMKKGKLQDEIKLALTRAFGDYEWKENDALPKDQQAVIAIPDVVVHERDPDNDTFLILACDGIWDVMSNEEVGQFVSTKVAELTGAGDQDYVLPVVADQLLQECFDRKSSDNMSVVIAALGPTADQVSPRVPRRLDVELGSLTSGKVTTI